MGSNRFRRLRKRLVKGVCCGYKHREGKSYLERMFRKNLEQLFKNGHTVVRLMLSRAKEWVI